jgi:hypothetical protein
MTNRYGRFAVTTAFGLALAMLAGRAYADEPAVTPTAEGTPPPGDATAPPATTPPPAASRAAGGPVDVTLPQGGININGDIVIGLYKDFAGKPISIVPNLYYGVNDQLTVGIAHNPIADTFATAGLARGLCLSGQSDGCAKVYNNLSLDVLFSFMRQAGMDLAGHGGIDFDQFSPDLFLALRVGVKGKMMAGPLMIIFDPFISFGLTKRDLGNKENLGIPVRLAFLATPELNINLSTGIFAPFDNFGDLYAIPLGIGAGYALNSQLDLRVQFTFDNLLGKVPDGFGRADARTLAIGAAFKM